MVHISVINYNRYQKIINTKFKRVCNGWSGRDVTDELVKGGFYFLSWISGTEYIIILSIKLSLNVIYTLLYVIIIF